MKYIEGGRIEIENKIKFNSKKRKEKPVLPNGTIIFCRGNNGAGSFYGMVYESGVIELESGSTAYIQKSGYLHLGDTISYWTIEKAVKAKLIIEDIIEED